MASEMLDALIALCSAKHIDQLVLLDRLEQTLADSYAKNLHCPFGCRVTIDRTTGNIYVYELVPVGEPNQDGDYETFKEVDITPKDISRFAAMAVKNEINDIVHVAEREQICKEFQNRIGDIINATVLQKTPDFTIVKIRDGVEAELPHYSLKKIEQAAKKRKENNIVLHELPQEINERPKGENYDRGQRIKAVIIGVRDPHANRQPTRGDRQRPAIIVSRTVPELIARLFELEVPEVYDGIVEIKSIARDPGDRSKVAVYSLDDHLDPVGACVGPKGSRIRSVVQELRGERVDVVLWDEDPAQFIANALSPAKVTSVVVDEDADRKYATVVVPHDQLSLTIGKGGQNARLAASLTGYHIDIKDESLTQEFLKNYSFDEDYLIDEDFMDDQEELIESIFDSMGEFEQTEVSDDIDSLI